MAILFRQVLKLFCLSLVLTSPVSFALSNIVGTSSVLTQSNSPTTVTAPAPGNNASTIPIPNTTGTISMTPGATSGTTVTTTPTLAVPNSPATTVPGAGSTTVVVTPPATATTVVPSHTVAIPSTPIPSAPAAVTTTVPVQTTQTTVTTTSNNQFDDWLRSNGYATLPAGPTTYAPSPSANKVYTSARVRDRGAQSFREGQKIMVESVPESPIPPPPDSRAAFRALLQQNMPLSPQQVVRLRQQIDLAQRAASTPPNIPPKPVSSTIMVNLAPGTTPPAVRLAQGYVTSLVFVDSTGAPWPISAFDIGNPKAVSIQWENKGNLLLIQAVSPYSDGDIVVRLVGLNTPITLELVAGQRVVDYRVDLHVAGIGPNAKELPMGTNLPNSANVLLLGVLDGVAPAGSTPLTVIGGDAQAWLLGGEIFFRTRMTVLSPGWLGRMVSPDGMIAYELPKTSSVLVSRYGEPTELRLEGF